MAATSDMEMTQSSNGMEQLATASMPGVTSLPLITPRDTKPTSLGDESCPEYFTPDAAIGAASSASASSSALVNAFAASKRDSTVSQLFRALAKSSSSPGASNALTIVLKDKEKAHKEQKRQQRHFGALQPMIQAAAAAASTGGGSANDVTPGTGATPSTGRSAAGQVGLLPNEAIFNTQFTNAGRLFLTKIKKNRAMQLDRRTTGFDEGVARKTMLVHPMTKRHFRVLIFDFDWQRREQLADQLEHFFEVFVTSRVDKAISLLKMFKMDLVLARVAKDKLVGLSNNANDHTSGGSPAVATSVNSMEPCAHDSASAIANANAKNNLKRSNSAANRSQVMVDASEAIPAVASTTIPPSKPKSDSIDATDGDPTTSKPSSCGLDLMDAMRYRGVTTPVALCVETALEQEQITTLCHALHVQGVCGFFQDGKLPPNVFLQRLHKLLHCFVVTQREVAAYKRFKQLEGALPTQTKAGGAQGTSGTGSRGNGDAPLGDGEEEEDDYEDEDEEDEDDEDDDDEEEQLSHLRDLQMDTDYPNEPSRVLPRSSSRHHLRKNPSQLLLELHMTRRRNCILERQQVDQCMNKLHSVLGVGLSSPKLSLAMPSPSSASYPPPPLDPPGTGRSTDRRSSSSVVAQPSPTLARHASICRVIPPLPTSRQINSQIYIKPQNIQKALQKHLYVVQNVGNDDHQPLRVAPPDPLLMPCIAVAPGQILSSSSSAPARGGIAVPRPRSSSLVGDPLNARQVGDGGEAGGIDGTGGAPKPLGAGTGTAAAGPLTCSSAPPLFQKAFLFYQEKKLQQALHLCDKFIKFQPTRHLFTKYTHVLRGVVLDQLGLSSEAMAAFSRAVNIDARLHQAWFNRSVCAMKLGKDQSALQDLNMALKVDPMNARYLHNRALMYRRMGQFDLAHKEYSKMESCMEQQLLQQQDELQQQQHGETATGSPGARRSSTMAFVPSTVPPSSSSPVAPASTSTTPRAPATAPEPKPSGGSSGVISGGGANGGANEIGSLRDFLHSCGMQDGVFEHLFGKPSDEKLAFVCAPEHRNAQMQQLIALRLQKMSFFERFSMETLVKVGQQMEFVVVPCGKNFDFGQQKDAARFFFVLLEGKLSIRKQILSVPGGTTSPKMGSRRRTKAPRGATGSDPGAKAGAGAEQPEEQGNGPTANNLASKTFTTHHIPVGVPFGIIGLRLPMHCQLIADETTEIGVLTPRAYDLTIKNDCLVNFQETFDFLRKHKAFGNLSVTELGHLTGLSQKLRFRKGEIVLFQDELPTDFFVLFKGTCLLLQEYAKTEQQQERDQQKLQQQKQQQQQKRDFRSHSHRKTLGHGSQRHVKEVDVPQVAEPGQSAKENETSREYKSSGAESSRVGSAKRKVLPYHHFLADKEWPLGFQSPAKHSKHHPKHVSHGGRATKYSLQNSASKGRSHTADADVETARSSRSGAGSARWPPPWHDHDANQEDEHDGESAEDEDDEAEEGGCSSRVKRKLNMTNVHERIIHPPQLFGESAFLEQQHAKSQCSIIADSIVEVISFDHMRLQEMNLSFESLQQILSYAPKYLTQKQASQEKLAKTQWEQYKNVRLLELSKNRWPNARKHLRMLSNGCSIMLSSPGKSKNQLNLPNSVQLPTAMTSTPMGM